MTNLQDNIVLVTGASSGIGRSCARTFARLGARLILAARREDRLQALADELSVPTHTIALDVCDRVAVETALEGLPADWQAIDVLVNNAGLSRGLDKLHEGSVQDWEEMIDTNIKGLLYITRLVVQGMVARDRGHVINIGSIAGHETYPNGNVYCATKAAVMALTEGLKLDLLGTPVRVSAVDPGLVETEFSDVRFRGDTERAKTVYAGMAPLTPDDIAEIVAFCATRPPHVNICDILVVPTDQSSATRVHRRS